MLNRLSMPIQVGISVSDVKLASVALSQLFAIDSWRFATWSADGVAGSTHRGIPNPDWKGELAFAQLGAIEIELIQDVAGASSYQESVARSGLGIRHIMFAVPDVSAAIKLAAQQGIGVSTQITNADGVPTWTVLDTSERFGFDVEIALKVDMEPE